MTLCKVVRVLGLFLQTPEMVSPSTFMSWCRLRFRDDTYYLDTLILRREIYEMDGGAVFPDE